MEQPAAGPGGGDDQQAMEELLVNELKAQGVFDQFRKDCLADVDTKVSFRVRWSDRAGGSSYPRTRHVAKCES